MSSFTHRYHDEQDDDTAASPHGNIDTDADMDMDTEMGGTPYAMPYTRAHNPLPQTYQYHYHHSPAPQHPQAQHFSSAQHQQHPQPPLHNFQHDARPNRRPTVPRTPPQTPISPSAPTHAHSRSTDNDSALFTHTADISLFAAALSGMHLDPSASALTPASAPTFPPESQHEQAHEHEHSLFAAAVAGLPAPPGHDDEDPVMRVADAMADDMVDDDGSGAGGGGEARAPGDVLPDYEQSQREAANLRRRAALRRAAELEARWKGVR